MKRSIRSGLVPNGGHVGLFQPRERMRCAAQKITDQTVLSATGQALPGIRQHEFIALFKGTAELRRICDALNVLIISQIIWRRGGDSNPR